MKKPRRLYSESFKRDKVKRYETGQMTISGMSRFYDISETALYKWVSKYRSTPETERIVLETESDYLKLVELQRRIDKMERLIGSQQLKIAYHESILKVAGEHYKEDIEKKFG